MKRISIRVAVVLAFMLAGALIWSFARWLVRRDDLYIRLHEAGFGFISSGAEMIAYGGSVSALAGGLILGVSFAAWFRPLRKDNVPR